MAIPTQPAGFGMEWDEIDDGSGNLTYAQVLEGTAKKKVMPGQDLKPTGMKFGQQQTPAPGLPTSIMDWSNTAMNPSIKEGNSIVTPPVDYAAQAEREAAAKKKAADDAYNTSAGLYKQGNLNAANSLYDQAGAGISSLMDLTRNRENPYSLGNLGMQAQRALAQNRINSGYKTAAQQLRQRLAQRGVLGTAQEDSALAGMSINSAKDMSQVETEIASDAYGKQQGFEQTRISSLSDLIRDQASLANARASFQSSLAEQELSRDVFDQGVKQAAQNQINIETDQKYRAVRDSINDANTKVQLDLLISQHNDAIARKDEAAAGSIWQNIGKILLPIGGSAATFFLSGGNPAVAAATYQILNGVPTSWPTASATPKPSGVKTLQDLIPSNGGMA